MEKKVGVVKKWFGRFGFIYSPNHERYFLPLINVISGTPELGSICRFDALPQNNPVELPIAIQVEVLRLVEDIKEAEAIMFGTSHLVVKKLMGGAA